MSALFMDFIPTLRFSLLVIIVIVEFGTYELKHFL